MSIPGYVDYKIAVPERCREVFSHFYYLKNESDETVTKTLMPSYQTILIFNFGANVLLFSSSSQIGLSKCIVLGPIKRAFDYSLPPGAEMLVVGFKDDAFYRFFGHAAVAEHQPVDPDSLLMHDCFTDLWDKLAGLEGNTLRIAQIVQFAEPYLLGSNQIAQQLANFEGLSASPIKAVASVNGQTERNVQLTQRKHFGYSAKAFSRYSRFLKAIELISKLLSNNNKVNWFEVIDACGYYDQSQLIRDFKYYTNLSPTKYLKFQKDICR